MFSTVFEAICLWWFKHNKWTISRKWPEALKKYVLIVAPHTSNWDFPIGIAARKILGINAKYVAKKELFKWPVRQTLLNLGGYPVDRSKANSFVDQVVSYFDAIDDFAVCITPEGTRSKVTRWKTGFYHMAVNAKVPIIMVGFDYEKRIVEISDPIWTTGTMDVDLEVMHRFFRTITPRYPEKSQYAESPDVEK